MEVQDEDMKRLMTRSRRLSDIEHILTVIGKRDEVDAILQLADKGHHLDSTTIREIFYDA